MFKNKYNTELTKEEQKEFDKWAEEESKKQGRDILMDKGAYDVQGFWKSGDWKNRDADNHGTDTWKKPITLHLVTNLNIMVQVVGMEVTGQKMLDTNLLNKLLITMDLIIIIGCLVKSLIVLSI